jgi:hypothetical protein
VCSVQRLLQQRGGVGRGGVGPRGAAQQLPSAQQSGVGRTWVIGFGLGFELGFGFGLGFGLGFGFGFSASG